MKSPAATAIVWEGPPCLGRLIVGLLAFMALVASVASEAHDGAPTAFASITVAGTRVLYSLTTSSRPPAQDGTAVDPGIGSTADARSRGRADPRDASLETPDGMFRMANLIARHLKIEADGRTCMPGTTDLVPPVPPRLSTTYNIEYRCQAPVRRLHVTDDSFDVIGRGTHTLLRVGIEGREEPVASTVLLADQNRGAVFDLGQLAGARKEGLSAPAPSGAFGFLPLGIQHILEGWDHLLFLLALVLPGGSLGNLARIVTAFTIAHSLTLAGAVLGLVSVPAAPVEALIALSIAWVAGENLARGRPMSRRWIVAFAFGLIHGFGFSNVLCEIGLPRDALLASLMWFNLGIEAGQLLVVLLLLPALAWLRRSRLGRPMPQALSALILVAGVVLLVLRL